MNSDSDSRGQPGHTHRTSAHTHQHHLADSTTVSSPQLSVFLQFVVVSETYHSCCSRVNTSGSAAAAPPSACRGRHSGNTTCDCDSSCGRKHTHISVFSPTFELNKNWMKPVPLRRGLTRPQDPERLLLPGICRSSRSPAAAEDRVLSHT